jgi:hypothetical protein
MAWVHFQEETPDPTAFGDGALIDQDAEKGNRHEADADDRRQGKRFPDARREKPNGNGCAQFQTRNECQPNQRGQSHPYRHNQDLAFICRRSSGKISGKDNRTGKDCPCPTSNSLFGRFRLKGVLINATATRFF